MYYIPTFNFESIRDFILTCNMHGNENQEQTPDSLQT